MHVLLILDEAPNLVASCWIWTASSRVGAKTNTIGPSPGSENIVNELLESETKVAEIKKHTLTSNKTNMKPNHLRYFYMSLPRIGCALTCTMAGNK